MELIAHLTDIVHFGENTIKSSYGCLSTVGRSMLQCKLRSEDPMRIPSCVIALIACATALSTPDRTSADPRSAISQRSSDVSAAKQKRVRGTPRSRPVESPHRYGGPDPSLGPDGRPYPVPEYLRGQCYYDEGYGRFSPCSNRN
jgi:hypothetical protein